MILILMGVAGSGKSTVGHLLATKLRWRFLDGDDVHSAVNKAKLARGEPLTDEDRAPWLAILRAEIVAALKTGTHLVLACSALRTSYRETLAVDSRAVHFIYLEGSPELLAARLQARRGHFMPAKLLPSQLATLEPPTNALVLDIAVSPAKLVEIIVHHFAL